MDNPYAVIVSGGKQHRVKVGQRLKLEKLAVEAGQTVELDKVLMVANGDQIQLGAPYLENSKVSAMVVSHGRGDKITIIKMRRRKNYRRKQGHRQAFTEIEVTAIQ
jgi:large subunit ribosomal protein L21